MSPIVTFARGYLNAALAGGLAAYTLIGVPASGATAASAGAPAIVVRYGDLDLSREEGLRVLYRRLRQAAAQVCRPEEGRDLTRRRRSRECREAAISDAVARSGNARLSAMHAARGASRAAPPLRVTRSH